MKKRFCSGILFLSSLFLLSSCNMESTNQNNNQNGYSQGEKLSVEDNEADNEVLTEVDETINDSTFSIETLDGGFLVDNNTYTITKGGTYILSGKLEGNILIDVKEATNDSYDVVLELNGVTIISSSNSPILALESDYSYNLEIVAKKDTTNIIKDLRSEKEADSELGEAAIYSNVDLEIKGKGILYVKGNYNNGIHTKDDLEIKNLTLSVEAVNNALKGNDSVTIESGELTIISTKGDGIETSNSELSSKGNQKGNVTISGGTITIYSLCDGIDSACDVFISDTADIEIYTSNYSSYSSEVASSLSTTLYLRAKSSSYRYSAYFYDNDGNGVFVNSKSMSIQGRTNYYYYTIDIPKGYTNVKFYSFTSNQENSLDTYQAVSDSTTLNTSYDMVTLSISQSKLNVSWSTYTTYNQAGGFGSFGPGGMNSNTEKSEYSAKGIKASNEIKITDGKLYIKAYDDGLHANNEELIESTSTYGKGNITISGGNISITSKDDGIHADNTIKVSDSAYINILESHEGIEANQIYFSGGNTYCYSKDDCINAAKAGLSQTPCIYISDTAYIDLDCASGDTDTLDSNGNIKMTGGTLIVKNRSSQAQSMTGGTIDLDGTFTMTGGILISFGTWCNEVNMSANVSKTTQVEKGTYTIKDSSGDVVLKTELEVSYMGYRVISKLSGSYNLYKDDTLISSF